jgi:hypothetical protein
LRQRHELATSNDFSLFETIVDKFVNSSNFLTLQRQDAFVAGLSHRPPEQTLRSAFSVLHTSSKLLGSLQAAVQLVDEHDHLPSGTRGRSETRQVLVEVVVVVVVVVVFVVVVFVVVVVEVSFF